MRGGALDGTDKLRVHWIARLIVAAPLEPRDARTFRQGARARTLEKLVRLRTYAAPVLGTVAITFAVFEASAWRRAVIAAVVLTLFVLTFVEWARYRRHGAEVVGPSLNFAVMLSGQLCLILATGGLLSPLVPALVVMGVMSAIFLEPRTQLLLFGAVVVPAIWLMAVGHVTVGLVPAVFGAAAGLEAGPVPWVAAGVYSLMIVATTRVGIELRATFERLFADAMRERDRVLELHAEQSRTLTALSAEIAHELKNPLASVKGLGALVAKDTEGRTAERVAVLRREVDRMQGILEELLTFSRPLVPLATEQVDARALAEEVVTLHEGFAAERGVRVALDAGPVASLRCDPRKVRRVLINLVQNAVDASPAGAEVRVTVRGEGEEVTFRIRDDGEGLREALRERVYEPGVTTKEHGSGMGLAVARSIARQHGGELILANAAAGGAEATLTLPREVVEVAP
jgi:two-component system, NtrC family, sensor histidine kinase HydH